VAFIYYTGHAVSKNGYSCVELTTGSYDLEDKIRTLSSSNSNSFVIGAFDACRDIVKTRDVGDSMSSATKNNYILIFSCQPTRQTIAESTFAEDLVYHLDKQEQENKGLVLFTALVHF
jgi:hypothetical protein